MSGSHPSIRPRRTFPDDPDAAISENLFQSVLNRALMQLHGVAGGAVPMQVLGPMSGPCAHAPQSMVGGVITPPCTRPGASATMVVKMGKR
jgi:hypothetical protein